MILILVLKICHIAAAAVWLGAGLSAPGDVRRTLALGQPHTAVLLPRLRAVAKIMNTSALFTFLTGAGLVLVTSGIRGMANRMWLAIVLTLLAVIVGRWMIRPVIMQIVQLAKGEVPADHAPRIATNFAIAVNTEHALRIAVLVLMIYPFSF